jgi:hypothetical protein
MQLNSDGNQRVVMAQSVSLGCSYCEVMCQCQAQRRVMGGKQCKQCKQRKQCKQHNCVISTGRDSRTVSTVWPFAPLGHQSRCLSPRHPQYSSLHSHVCHVESEVHFWKKDAVVQSRGTLGDFVCSAAVVVVLFQVRQLIVSSKYFCKAKTSKKIFVTSNV